MTNYHDNVEETDIIGNRNNREPKSKTLAKIRYNLLFQKEMRTTEILSRLHKAEFTEKQAKELAEILEDVKDQQVSKENIEMAITKAKYELVKWIVAGVVVNGVVATLLKYAG